MAMIFGNDRFQIRHGESIVLAGDRTVTGECPQGLAMDQLAPNTAGADNNDLIATPAGAGGAIGFLTQRVVTTPSVQDMLLGNVNAPQEAAVGERVTLERLPAGAEIEVECENGIASSVAHTTGMKGGYHLVTSSTGAISATTAQGTQLSFENGRWRTAASGSRVTGTMLFAGLTPKTAGNIRCLIRIEDGTKLA
jgi:hypothetical protein